MSAPSVLTNVGASSSWFDAFRDNGGPVLYSSMNRTPAIEDIRNILIYISFSTLFVAFLIIFPGIRKERFSTFICVTISLFMGAVILLSNCGTNWHVASASIASPYRAFSREKIFADVGVHIGLDSVNITLKALPIHPRAADINYNERFYWIGPSQMKQEFQRALAKGLPYPILTIAEYLSQDGEGFNWGRHYRLAGYYTGITLWLAFACWILMNILLCAVPRYGAYMMQVTGLLLLFSNLLYGCLIPAKPLRIPFEGATLTFNYGYCFWMVFSAGITAVVIGATVSIVDILFPNKFSTILEVDYDTPYRYFVGNDAHIIGSLPPPLSSYYSYHHHHHHHLHHDHHNHHDGTSSSGGGGQSSSLSTGSHRSSSHHLYQKKKDKMLSSSSGINVSKLGHYSASKTASIATDSTCCAGSSTVTTATTSMSHRVVSKTKSDASTCTRDDIADDLHLTSSTLNMVAGHQSSSPSTASSTASSLVSGLPVVKKNSSTSTFLTTVDIESHHHQHLVLDSTDKDNNNHVVVDDDVHQMSLEMKRIGGGGGGGGVENAAYAIDDADDDEIGGGGALQESKFGEGSSSKKEVSNKINNKLTTRGASALSMGSSPPSSSSSSSLGDASSDEEGEMSDVSTTIIDGKRAISLSNFGKFAAAQQKKDGGRPMASGLPAATFGYQLASVGYRAANANAIPKRIQQNREKLKADQQAAAAAASSAAAAASSSSTSGKSPSTSKVDLSSPSAMW